METGPEPEATEESTSWLTLYGLLSLLCYTTKDHQSRGDIIHSGLGPPILIIHSEYASEVCLQVSLVWEFSQLKFLLLK